MWDGTALHPLCAPGRFLSNKDNLAISLSTDGIPLYKSSTVSLWPVYAVVLNLPANIRMNSENVILCSIWLGPGKPLFKLLLNPVSKCFQYLSTLGIKLVVGSTEVIVRAKLVNGIFDLPAKATVLCAKQFNGMYGCSVCLHPGKRLPNNSRVYLPEFTHLQRTHPQVISAASEAEKTNSCVQGIYGLSSFANTFDIW